MPPKPGVVVEGGVYHVYNRLESGEPVFADPDEALDRHVGTRTMKPANQRPGPDPQEKRRHRDVHSTGGHTPAVGG